MRAEADAEGKGEGRTALLVLATVGCRRHDLTHVTHISVTAVTIARTDIIAAVVVISPVVIAGLGFAASSETCHSTSTAMSSASSRRRGKHVIWRPTSSSTCAALAFPKEIVVATVALPLVAAAVAAR